MLLVQGLVDPVAGWQLAAEPFDRSIVELADDVAEQLDVAPLEALEGVGLGNFLLGVVKI